MKHTLTLCIAGLSLLGANIATTASAAEAPSPSAIRRAAFGVEDIRLGGIIGERLERTIRGNLLKVNFDTPELLNDFRPDHRVSLPIRPDQYTGLGKSMAAAVNFAAYTGDPEVIALKNHLIETILAGQDADGYIGRNATPDLKRRNQNYVYHELAYILKALLRDHEVFGSARSLEAARKLGDWNIANWGDKPLVPILWGYESAMLDLYAATGEQRYLDFMKQTFLPGGNFVPVWQGIIGFREGKAQPLDRHAYNYLATSMAMLDLNDRAANPSLPLARDAAIQFLKTGGSTPAGVFTWAELWTQSQFGRDGQKNPSQPDLKDWRTGENCAQCYLEHFLNDLQHRDPTAWNGDVMERVLYNALFGAQSKDGRRVRYSTPVEGQRFYYQQDSFCCPNNFRLAMSLVPSWFYYATPDGILVNLYGESEATIRLASGNPVRLRQQTGYPFAGDVRMTLGLEKAETFALRFRIPAWTRGTQPTVTINGQPQSKVMPGSLLTITREWHDGDLIELKFPIRNQWIAGHSEQQGRAVLMRGPIVYALNPLLNELGGYTDLVKEDEVYSYWRIIASGAPDYAGWFRKLFVRELPDYEASYATLQRIKLQTASLSAPFADATFFESGNALTVAAWSDAARNGRYKRATGQQSQFRSRHESA